MNIRRPVFSCAWLAAAAIFSLASPAGAEAPDPQASDIAVGEDLIAGANAERWSPDLDRLHRELRSALARGDAIAMSLLVNFPLRVNFDDGSTILIADERTLRIRFEEVFPKAFRSAVLERDKTELDADGSIGGDYMIADGSVWMKRFGGEIGSRWRVDAVNVSMPHHASASKRAVLYACETAKHRIVIDETDGKKPLRYRAWNKPHFPPDPPDLTLSGGNEQVAGTGPCSSSTWTFSKGHTTIQVQESRCTAGSDAPPDDTRAQVVIAVDGKAKQVSYCF